MNIKELSEFLTELKANNKKAWMDENRDWYKKLREEFKELVGEVILRIGMVDEVAARVEPGRAMFRINRDIRFSKNKTPYKPHFSAAFLPYGKKRGNAGYYLRINHLGELCVGGGIYKPSADQLWEIREDIAKYPEHVHGIIDKPTFKKQFDVFDTEKLKSAPRGYTKDHPEIDLLKLKHFFGFVRVDLLKGKNKNLDIVNFALGVYEDVSPFVKWLREVTAGAKKR